MNQVLGGLLVGAAIGFSVSSLIGAVLIGTPYDGLGLALIGLGLIGFYWVMRWRDNR